METDVLARYNRVKSTLDAGVKLVAVSKFHPAEMIRAVYDGGQRIFGESRVQELCDKVQVLPNDIEWHFIGHLQTNKVKYIVPFVSLIHGVDSFRLLREIDKESSKIGRVTNCLLQMHVAQEETKFGFSLDELQEMLGSDEFSNLKNVSIRGLMGMASNTDNMNQVQGEFKLLKQIYDQVKAQYFGEEFCELSMGMSHDYTFAMKEGSTMVRIGTSIFGERQY